MNDREEMMQLIDRARVDRVRFRRGRPYILVGGILKTAHNTLLNIAIGKAANEARGWNVGYMCFTRESEHYCDQLFAKVGFEPFELTTPRVFYKASALIQGLWHYVTRGPSLEGLSVRGVPVGDLIYDTVVRRYPEVYSLAQATPWHLIKEFGRSRALAGRAEEIFRSEEVAMVVLSHKVYTQYGVPARVATVSGSGFVSKNRAHLNRIEDLEGHFHDDYSLSLADMRSVIDVVGQRTLQEYARRRFRGDVSGMDVRYAYGDKEEYEARELRREMGLDADKPIGLIAAHAFSDAPHARGEMVYSDYWEWFVKTLELTANVSDVQWIVKPHPSSKLYSEIGVVEKLVQEQKHVALVPAEARTDSVLRIASAVLTVRGTIGMEALLFDCDVLITGNAIYEEIPAVTLCRSESEYEERLRALATAPGEVCDQDKLHAMAALYYANESRSYVSPLFGSERPPGMSGAEALGHDVGNIRDWAEALEHGGYRSDEYYQRLVEFFERGSKRLSIVDLMRGGCERPEPKLED